VNKSNIYTDSDKSWDHTYTPKKPEEGHIKTCNSRNDHDLPYAIGIFEIIKPMANIRLMYTF